MKNAILLYLCLSTIAVFSSATKSQSVTAVPQKIKILASKMGYPNKQVELKTAPGIFFDDWYVMTLGDSVVTLVSKNGETIIGDAYDVKAEQSIVEPYLNKLNRKKLKEISDEIVFKSPNEKGFVWAFTDISCPFCQRFQANMQQYLDAGITVKYVAFPRSKNISNQDWKDAQKVWCSPDPQKAMKKAKKARSQRKEPRFKMTKPTQLHCLQIIPQHLEQAEKLGVTATPTFFTDSGKKVVGLVSPDKLLELLN